MEPLERKVNKLPEELQRQVADFVDFLLTKNNSQAQKRTPTLSWFGGLKELRNKYTALELQKKIIDWID